ncbi:hypothetical protein P4472_08840 [Bacillus subtilis]|nr:hypothetical protein [Bacillus subtilis]MED3602048.1 hypothetical protein [Bacillus subtilis]MED3626337.1 hypothetical protein [Bacillus subtilis]MED3692464.1 hypothetical protein [Bacillus subtilis]
MKHTLYITKVSDDKRVVYAYLVTNYQGIKTSGLFVTAGKHKYDGSRTDHIALQRSLRAASELAGVVDLKIVFDQPLIDLAFEMVEVAVPKYPSLYQTSARLMGRFQSHEFASTVFTDMDACPEEVSAIDEAMEMLDGCRSLKGRLLLLKNYLIHAKNIIS